MSNEEEKIANENLNSIREKNNRYLKFNHNLFAKVGRQKNQEKMNTGVLICL